MCICFGSLIAAWLWLGEMALPWFLPVPEEPPCHIQTRAEFDIHRWSGESNYARSITDTVNTSDSVSSSELFFNIFCLRHYLLTLVSLFARNSQNFSALFLLLAYLLLFVSTYQLWLCLYRLHQIKSNSIRQGNEKPDREEPSDEEARIRQASKMVMRVGDVDRSMLSLLTETVMGSICIRMELFPHANVHFFIHAVSSWRIVNGSH